MGFFSKKQEPAKDNNAYHPMEVVAKCPICNRENSFKILWDHRIVLNKNGVSKDFLYELKQFYGFNVGVCPSCGIIQYDTVIYKSNDFNKSWKYYKDLTHYFTLYLFNYDLNIRSTPEMPENEKLKRVLEISTNIKGFIKNDIPDFPEEIDFVKFMGNCIRFANQNK